VDKLFVLRSTRAKLMTLSCKERSRLPLVSSQLCLAERGYQGFAKLHTGACTPTIVAAPAVLAEGREAA